MAGKQWREFVFETKRQKAPNTGKAEKAWFERSVMAKPIQSLPM